MHYNERGEPCNCGFGERSKVFKRSPDQLQDLSNDLVVSQHGLDRIGGHELTGIPDQQWDPQQRITKHIPNPVTHYNLHSGLPCNCPWHFKTLNLRHTAGVNINKILKAPDKAYKTPEGEAFRQKLPEFVGDDYDSLAPYIAQRWKKGEIRLHPETGEPIVQTNQDFGYTTPADEYSHRTGWAPLRYSLPAWHQFFEARQHPVRRGVNIMDPNFTVHNMRQKVHEHQEALEQERQLARVANHGKTVWQAPPEFGPKYKHWHIKHLTEGQNDAGEYDDPTDALEAEGEAMNHCIGSDDQPYKECANQGKISVYSLRDKRGYPHATWHYNNSDGSLAEMFGHSDSGLTDDYQAMVDHWGRQTNHDTQNEVGHQEGGGYDAEYQLSDPTTTDELITSYDNPNEEAYEDYNANIGENTEIIPGSPQWNEIASDYLNGGTSNPQYFNRILGYMNSHRDMAQALQEEFDPDDSTHREWADNWNSYCPGGHEIDIPTQPANDVSEYNEGHEYGEEREPDWDRIAKDYLDNASPGDSTYQYQRKQYQPNRHPSELQKFHDYLIENLHTDDMASALENNVNWEDADHQNAIQQWNYGMPEHNIFPRPAGTMQWTPEGQFQLQQSPVRNTWEDPTLPIEQRLQQYGEHPEWRSPSTFSHMAGSPVTHHNQWTGLPCNCPWHYESRHLRHRTAGQNINKVLKAPDKAFRTPEGERFRQALPDALGEEYDPLAPYIAQRFKKGEIRTGNPHDVQQFGQEHNPLLYVQGTPDQRYDLDPMWDEEADRPASQYNAVWRPLNTKLGGWNQWYNAKQHPTRRGVNIMDPNFTVHEMDRKVRQHQQALQEEAALREAAKLGQTVHQFPPRTGGGIDWNDALNAVEQGEYDWSWDPAIRHLMENEGYPDPYYSEAMDDYEHEFNDKHFPTDYDYDEQLAQHQHEQQYRRDDLENIHNTLKKNHWVGDRKSGWHIKHLNSYQNDAGEPNDVGAAMEHEGRIMGHCVGSDEQPYKRCAQQGSIDAYSLRDPKGQPHVTWHYNSDGTLAEMFGPNDDAVKPAYQQMLDEWGANTGKDTRREDAMGHQETPGLAEWTDENPETVDDYLAQYGEDRDLWQRASESGEDIDEDTQINPGEPQWPQIAENMMGYRNIYQPDTYRTQYVFHPTHLPTNDELQEMYAGADWASHLPQLNTAMNEFQVEHPGQQDVKDYWNQLPQMQPEPANPKQMRLPGNDDNDEYDWYQRGPGWRRSPGTFSGFLPVFAEVREVALDKPWSFG